MKKIKISKLDAARRQILTAIQLHFNNGDILSIHTLSSAAFKITLNISDSSADLPDSLTDWAKQHIKPEAQKMVWKKLHETANFLKHAENDTDGTHEFHPEHTVNMLFLASDQYWQLTGEWLAEIKLFNLWYMVQHPESFTAPEETKLLSKAMFGEDRSKYWHEHLPLLRKLSKGLTQS